MPPPFETIRYDVEGPVAFVTMNRPDAANAQSSTMIDEIDAALDLADADDAVRVVVLGGAGKHFSAGHDLGADSDEVVEPGDSVGVDVGTGSRCQMTPAIDISATERHATDRPASPKRSRSIQRAATRRSRITGSTREWRTAFVLRKR